jgi:hypothetical protein
MKLPNDFKQTTKNASSWLYRELMNKNSVLVQIMHIKLYIKTIKIMKAVLTCVGLHKPSSGSHSHGLAVITMLVIVVLAVFSVMVAYAAVTLNTAITTSTLEPTM